MTSTVAIAYFSRQLHKAQCNYARASVVPNRSQEAEGLRNKIECLEMAIAALEAWEGEDFESASD